VVAGVVIVAALSIVAVVISIGSVSRAGDLERATSAIRLQTNCRHLVVTRPSGARLVRSWPAHTADIFCPGGGPGLVYAAFADSDRLHAALFEDPPAQRYCTAGNVIVIDRVLGPSTLVSDVCQSLGGTLVTPGAP
jgi:hypothetical protein